MGYNEAADGTLEITDDANANGGPANDMQAIVDMAVKLGGLLKGTQAQREALTSGQVRDGWIFIETDTGVVYARQSGAWVPVFGKTPAVRVGRSTAHSSGSPFQTNGGTFRLNWDREDEDPYDMHSAAAPERLTVPAGWGGVYSFFAKTRVEDNTDSVECLFFLDKNGVKADFTEMALQGPFYKRGMISGEIKLAAGDWVAFAVNKTGAAANLSPVQSVFGLRWERP